VAARLFRTLWRFAEVVEVVAETPRTKSLVLGVPDWEGHKAGQHVDLKPAPRRLWRGWRTRW
jgi:ferredoxin-NADP reductase